MILAMRASACIHLHLADEERVALLLEDYDWFVQQPEFFCERLSALTELRGREVVGGWQARIREGRTPEVVRELLVQHYDPMYAASIHRNFAQWPQAQTVCAPDRSAEAMSELARALTDA